MSTGTRIIPSQRHLFDIPNEVAYFNCSYYSPQLNESRDRLLAGARAKSRPWERVAANFFEDAERLRRLGSEVLGGDEAGYAVVPAASYGMSTAARAVEPRLRLGQRILVMADEFPSNVLPWKRAAEESGAALVSVPTPENGDWTQAILERIDASVKVVAVSTCHWTNGAYIDLRPIGKGCRDAGVILAVDATQSLGAMPFPIGEVDPDFVVAAGYKWLLGPYGFGLFYVSEQWRNARPLEESWLARRNAEDFAALVACSDSYMRGARRFDVGEKCTPTILPGAIAALEQIREWGIEGIAASLAVINARIAAHLEDLGFLVPRESHRCPHMFGAQLLDMDAGRLAGELRTKDIYVSHRGQALRFAPHLYVNDHDVDRLLEALREVVN
jgi:selenocysteine lyase/cysteine desulfurase